MFIGGLNWDTTDGTYIIVIARSCFRAVVLNSNLITREPQKVLFAIRQGRGLYHHARRCWTFKMLRVLDI